MNSSRIFGHFENWRMFLIYGVVGGVFLFFTIRLFTLQVITGQTFIDQANENRIKNVSESTQRGIINDRNGYVLARNVPSYT